MQLPPTLLRIVIISLKVVATVSYFFFLAGMLGGYFPRHTPSGLFLSLFLPGAIALWWPSWPITQRFMAWLGGGIIGSAIWGAAAALGEEFYFQPESASIIVGLGNVLAIIFAFLATLKLGRTSVNLKLGNTKVALSGRQKWVALALAGWFLTSWMRQPCCDDLRNFLYALASTAIVGGLLALVLHEVDRRRE